MTEDLWLDGLQERLAYDFFRRHVQLVSCRMSPMFGQCENDTQPFLSDSARKARKPERKTTDEVDVIETETTGFWPQWKQ